MDSSITLSSKLPKVNKSIFSTMSELANATKAINLSQGFPDFAVDKTLIELVHDNMQKGFNQYAPMQGVWALREKIAEKVELLYSAQYDVETEITITAGATQAIYSIIATIVKEGDEVIVFEPAYDSYVPAIELNGGVPILVQLQPPQFSINWEEVQKLINQRTKLIIINTPHNPTGSILTATDMMRLEKLVKQTDIVILSDEVYEHIIFDGYEHQSLARYPELANRSYIVSSFGKTFHTTGWKLGYVLAPKNLTSEFRKVHQFIVFAANMPMQQAFAQYMTQNDTKIYAALAQFYQEKRDFFLKLIKGSKFSAIPALGTYFQLLKYDAITDEKDTDFAIRLTKDYGVASIPVSVFYRKPLDNKVLRFCFAKQNETLEKAAEILCKI